MVRSGRSVDAVIPVLVTGIQRTACSGVGGAVDPDDPGQFAGAGKSRDDKDGNNG
jgi:hypothetical protein